MGQAGRTGLFREAREERTGREVGMGKNKPGIKQVQTIDM